MKNLRVGVLKLWEHKPDMVTHASNVPVFLWGGGLLVILARSACHNKISEMICTKQQELIFLSLGG